MAKVLPKEIIVYAESLEDAYKKGYFSGSILREELMNAVTRYNPSLRWFSNQTHKCLWDSSKGENGFVTGITHNITIPKFTICRRVSELQKKINFSNPQGEVVGSQVINKDDKDGYVLARSWIKTIETVQRKGYEVYTKGLI